jgi:site-specific recombinase XerD
MRWGYWLELYLNVHCTARGLRPKTIAAYGDALRQFKAWALAQDVRACPSQITPSQVLTYIEYLRRERGNGDSAVNRAVVILRSYYRAIVAMGHLAHSDNPMAGFPTIRAVPRKLPVVLSTEQVQRLIGSPRADTILGLRDRAMLILLYGSGIRASECAGLQEGDVDLIERTVRVNGKGGHERVIPLNERVVQALKIYVQVRGPALPKAPFFRSRFGRALTRGAVFERVRSWGLRSHVSKAISPHRLRHTFATHLIRAGTNLITVRDLLGHRQLSSTQIYLHVTAHDLRAAAERHPISTLIGGIEHILGRVKLPFQHFAGLRGSG